MNINERAKQNVRSIVAFLIKSNILGGGTTYIHKFEKKMILYSKFYSVALGESTDNQAIINF